MRLLARRVLFARLLVCVYFFLGFSQLLYAQPPYIEDSLLTIPVVQVAGQLYRVELNINASNSPISFTVAYAEQEMDFNVNSTTATMAGLDLTIPKIRYAGKNYELVLTLVNENPVTFHLTGVREISENFDAVDLRTYSPEACHADIKLLLEESIVLNDHFEAYKGDFFGSKLITPPGASFAKSALVSLVTDTPLITAGDKPAGTPEGTIFTMPVSELTQAPDHGLENDPDYPIAFRVNVKESAFINYLGLYRSDGKGGLSQVVAAGQQLNLGSVSGEVDTFYKLTLAPENALFFVLKFENNDKEYLVKQDGVGGSLGLLLAQGSYLNTGDPTSTRLVGKFREIKTNSAYQAIVKIEVVDENQVYDGFAYLAVDDFTGSNQCISTDTILSCGGPLVYNGQSLDSISTDGATTGAVLTQPGDETLEYKVVGEPTVLTLNRNTPHQGFVFNGFKRPRVCESKNALYFVGSFYEAGIGGYDELMRIDEQGNMKQLTDFRSLLLTPSLQGQVPDEIVNWAIGYNCDAALYTWGPSGPNTNQGYEGYWATYVTGETMEILDETPGQPNGNDNITDVSRSTSGIDISTNAETVVNTGPNGEFYFLPNFKNGAGKTVSHYAVATKPSTCQ